MELTNNNIVVYAAKHYYTPKCIDGDEFFEDLKRFKYVKRLLNRYRDTGELSERLLLNHLVVIFNVFGYEPALRILELKIEDEHWGTLKPFLLFLKAINYDNYPLVTMDEHAISKLREIRESD